MWKFPPVTSRFYYVLALSMLVIICFAALPCFADLDTALRGVKRGLTSVVLPSLSVLGMGWAAISFFTGSPQAKTHIFYAILGCFFGFGAQIIVDFISSYVH